MAQAEPLQESDKAPLTAGIAALSARVAACRICRDAPLGPPLPHAPRPIFRFSPAARLAIASQAPGVRAHLSGVPFDDASGRRLRDWLGIGPDLFYDSSRLVIVPMGFCFPGHDAAKGDLPPRRECRLAWHDTVFAAMPQLETIVSIGLHAIRYHAARLHPDRPPATSLAAAVMGWRALFEAPGRPRILALPHPSWRNTAWLNRNPWFGAEVLPVLRAEVHRLVVAPSPFSDS